MRWCAANNHNFLKQIDGKMSSLFLGMLVSVSCSLILSSCAINTPAEATVCASSKTTLALGTDLRLTIDSEILLENWKGLAGVVVEHGKSCKVQVEIVPHPTSGTESYKSFLWSEADCTISSEYADLYLAFKKGYLKTQIQIKQPSSPLDESVDANVSQRLSPRHAINNVIYFNYGEGQESSYDVLGHIVDEFEFQQPQTSIIRNYLNLVITDQLNKRPELIPAHLESHVSAFRNFFLRETVLKRSLLKFSQESWFRTGRPEEYQQLAADQLETHVTQDLWADVQEYFSPIKRELDFNQYFQSERESLNDALSQILSAGNLFLRVPLDKSSELSPETSGQRASFTDARFELLPIETVPPDTSPFALSEALSNGGYLQVTGLEPLNFCDADESRFFRKSRAWDLLTESGEERGNSVYVGLGSAQITLAGILPVARKRPQSSVCEAEPDGVPSPWQSGGAGIMPLPQLVDSELDGIQVLSESDIEQLAAVTAEESKSVSPSTEDDSEDGSTTVNTKIPLNCAL